jgi:two-component system response regulator HydG
VPLLVRHFLQQFTGSTDEYQIESEAMELLMDYDWPGNVRELRNGIERAVVLCEGNRISADLFHLQLDSVQEEARDEGVPVPIDLPYRDAMDRMTTECQRHYLMAALRRNGGNVTKAAEHAGIERESFHRLMRKCGIRSEDVKRELNAEAEV